MPADYSHTDSYHSQKTDSPVFNLITFHFLNGNINAHSHATQTQNNIGQMTPIHEYARKCIRYKVPMTVNNAPAEIVNKLYSPGT